MDITIKERIKQHLIDVSISSAIAFSVAAWRGRTIASINPVTAALCASVSVFVQLGIVSLGVKIHDRAIKTIYGTYKPNTLLMRAIPLSLFTATTLLLGPLSQKTGSSFELYTGWFSTALYIGSTIKIHRNSDRGNSYCHPGPCHGEPQVPRFWFSTHAPQQ